MVEGGAFAGSQEEVLGVGALVGDQRQASLVEHAAGVVERDGDAVPGVWDLGGSGALELELEPAAGLENAGGLAEVGGDDVEGGDVLKDDVGKSQVERGVGEGREIGAGGKVQADVGEVGETLLGEADHFGGDIDGVDLGEMLGG